MCLCACVYVCARAVCVSEQSLSSRQSDSNLEVNEETVGNLSQGTFSAKFIAALCLCFSLSLRVRVCGGRREGGSAWVRA